jgi:hypothetical protein
MGHLEICNNTGIIAYVHNVCYDEKKYRGVRALLYREDKASGNQLSILGMGCMRFPMDKAETERLILTAIEGGVNFFDTAYIYPGSEKTLGDILARNNKRKQIHIATKMPLTKIKSTADFDKYFNEQLQRLQTDYIDYYFLHHVTDFAQWGHLKQLGIENWLAQKKDAGTIRNAGFSYHGTYNDFVRVLEDYPWGFCMLQYNYYDENYQAGRRGVEAAAQRGVSVMVMEPLLGGRLATGLPKTVARLLANANPARTPAEWAFNWLWDKPGVIVAVSGMSSKAIVEKNLLAAERFTPLTETETAVYADVTAQFRKAYKINCTGCNYCLPCPMGINIPACLAAFNARYVQGYITGMMLYGTSTAIIRRESKSPHQCNQCGKCEKHCPQNIPIRKELKRVARKMEPWVLRVLLAAVRGIMARL